MTAAVIQKGIYTYEKTTYDLRDRRRRQYAVRFVFGAGNLIFPVFMGQAAGANVWRAVIGFLITGVGIPLLGVAALGMSRSDGLFQ